MACRPHRTSNNTQRSSKTCIRSAHSSRSLQYSLSKRLTRVNGQKKFLTGQKVISLHFPRRISNAPSRISRKHWLKASTVLMSSRSRVGDCAVCQLDLSTWTMHFPVCKRVTSSFLRLVQVWEKPHSHSTSPNKRLLSTKRRLDIFLWK